MDMAFKTGAARADLKARFERECSRLNPSVEDLEAAFAASIDALNEVRSRGPVAPAGSSRQVRRRLDRNGDRDAGSLGAVDRAWRDMRRAERELRHEKLRRAGIKEKPTLVRPPMNTWQRWQGEA